MRAPRRDILVLVKDSSLSDRRLHQEANGLHRLLDSCETIYNFCKAHEVLDLINFKKSHSLDSIRREIREQFNRPFVFVVNLN